MEEKNDSLKLSFKVGYIHSEWDPVIIFVVTFLFHAWLLLSSHTAKVISSWRTVKNPILTSKYSTKVWRLQTKLLFPHPQLGADCICLRSLQNRETKQPFMPQKAFCPRPRKRQTIQANDGGMIWACMTAVKLSNFSRKTRSLQNINGLHQS